MYVTVCSVRQSGSAPRRRTHHRRSAGGEPDQIGRPSGPEPRNYTARAHRGNRRPPQAGWTAEALVVQAFRPAVCTTQTVITRRPRRLDGVSYVGFRRYFITTCTAYRAPVFTDPQIVGLVRASFLQVATKMRFETTVSCFMPDHVHLLLVAQSEQCDLCRCIKQRNR
jgi:Transposase IS200 like